MSNAGTEVCDIETNISVSGEKAYPTSIELEMGVGVFVKASVDYIPDSMEEAEVQAVDLSSSDVMATLGDKQQKVLKEDRSSPDSQFELKVKSDSGGDKLHIKFNAYTQSPFIGYSPYNVALGASLLDEYAVIDTARFGIYDSVFRDSTQVKRVGPSLEDCAYDIPQLIVRIAEEMIKQADRMRSWTDPNLSEADKKAKQMQHQLNKEYVLPKLKEIFGRSHLDELKDSISKLANRTQIDMNICETITRHLNGNTGSFITTIANLCDEFQAVFTPQLNWPEVQYVIKSKAEVMNEATPIQLPIQSLSATVASDAGVFPGKYAVCELPLPASTQLGQPSNSVMVHPADNMTPGASAYPVAAPSWLGLVSIPVQTEKDGAPTRKDEGFSSHQEAADKTKESYKKVGQDTTDILKNWVETFYKWTALGACTCIVSCPMNVQVEPGKRYEVQNMNGDTLFKGYAYHVMYSIKTGSGSSNSATVNISFSHVEFGNFKL